MSKGLSILLLAKDMASKTIKGVSKEIGGLGKMGRTAGRGLSTLGANVAKMGMVAAAGLGAFVVAGVKMAGDFEAQMNTINTVAMLTVDQLAAVGDGIRKLARDSGAPLEDLTAAYYDLVSAGVAVADAQGVLTAANTLAVGGLGTTAETVDLLTTALNSYGMKASQAGVVADQFAQAIGAGKVTAAELAASFAEVGPVAATAGIGINELAAGYAQLTAKGVAAGTSATQMARSIISLLKPNLKLNALQKETGLNFAKIAKDKGLVKALERMRVEAKKANVPFVRLFESSEAYAFALQTTGDALKGYEKNLDAVNKSEGVAAKQAAERKKGLDFQLSRIRALARDAAITIGSKLLPKITPIIEKLAAFIDAHQADIERFGDALARGFEGAAIWAQKLPWDQIATGLQAGAGFAKTMVEAFARMPPEVMGVILALGGLNKLTGGAIGSIVGQLGSGLIKGVLGMTAAKVNVAGAVVTVTGGAGVLPAGGAAAGIGLVSAAALVGILGSAAVVSWLSSQKFAEENTRLADQGLTPAQIQAKKLSEMSPADRARALKSTAILPSNRTPEGRAANLGAGGKPTPLGPPVPPGLTNAKLQGTGSMMLNMPGVAGIFSRAVAKGFDPTALSLQKTLERNAERTKEAAEASRKTALAVAIAERARSFQQMFANLQLGAIARKDFSPHVGFKLSVNVNQTLSVRDQRIVNRKSYSYQGGSTAGGTVVAG